MDACPENGHVSACCIACCLTHQSNAKPSICEMCSVTACYVTGAGRTFWMVSLMIIMVLTSATVSPMPMLKPCCSSQ